MRPCRPSTASLAMRIPAMSTMSRPCMSARLFSSSSSATSSDSSSSSSERTSSDLAHRSLFINVRPSPTSLAERRSVLGVLERYGKAKFFKKLADNSSFVCIASSTAMASTLVQRSPFQYELLAETLQAAKPWGQPRVASLVQPIETTAASSSHSSSSPSASPSSSSSPIQNRSFVISVFPIKDYNHRSVTRSSPLHGPWPRDRDEGPSGMQTIVSSNSDGYRDTFVYNALRAVVPESASSAALCDWRTRQPAAGYDAAVTATSDSTLDKKATSRIQERRAKRAYEGKSILSTLVGRTSGNGGSNGGKGNSGGNSYPDT